MPMYEFLCKDCNRVFNFLARTPDAAKRKPACPKCGGRRMSRLFSVFAIGRNRGERPKEPSSAAREDGDDLSPEQLARMERAMANLERDIASIDEDNPRQIAAVMRKLSDVSGESLGPEMDEMIRRLEAGEDPEKVEEDMADLLGEDGPGSWAGGAPTHDDGLYDL